MAGYQIITSTVARCAVSDWILRGDDDSQFLCSFPSTDADRGKFAFESQVDL